MDRRVWISVLVMAAMATAWSGVAGAATCLRWAYSGGSRVCCAWSTKGVQVEVDFQQDCGPLSNGEGEYGYGGDDGGNGTYLGCSATATAFTDNSVAFCQAANGKIHRVPCSEEITFQGFENECVPKHDKDDGDNDPPGRGHENDKGNHGCTMNIILEAGTECDRCCESAGFPAGSCVDVTPVTMSTTLFVTNNDFNAYYYSYNGENGGDSGGDDGDLRTCDPDEPSCTIHQECSINANAIGFMKVKPYSCKLVEAPDLE